MLAVSPDHAYGFLVNFRLKKVARLRLLVEEERDHRVYVGIRYPTPPRLPHIQHTSEGLQLDEGEALIPNSRSFFTRIPNPASCTFFVTIPNSSFLSQKNTTKSDKCKNYIGPFDFFFKFVFKGS